MSRNSENLIIDAVSFDPSVDFTYTKPRVNKAGGKAVGIINSHTNRQLMLSTPLMMTWGVNERVDEQSGKKSYDMSLQFNNSVNFQTEQEKAFLKNLNDFEQKIKLDAIEHSKQWLNKATLNEAQADVLFHPMLYRPADPEKAPSLKVKLDYWDEKFTCEIFDIEQKQLFPENEEGDNVSPQELITKGSHVACIIKCGGIWFANGKFGVTWKLVQSVVKPKQTLKQGKCHIQLSNDDREKLMNQADTAKVEETTETTKKPTTETEDSDNEEDEHSDHEEETQETNHDVDKEEEEETHEPEPEPEQKPKKAVRKKVIRKA